MPALRVTFDTNVLDLACRPERFPRDPRQPHLRKVHDALAAGTIRGYYPVTMLTLEGIQKADRGAVYSGTRIRKVDETVGVAKKEELPDAIRPSLDGEDFARVEVRYQVQQHDRKPLHPEVQARVAAAHAL